MSTIKTEIIDYKTFERTILDLKEMEEFYSELEKIYGKYNWETSIMPLSFNWSSMNLLKAIFHDELDWIDYWVYELNYGKDYQDGDVIQNGKNVPLKTIEDLYNFLLRNLKERGDE